LLPHMCVAIHHRVGGSTNEALSAGEGRSFDPGCGSYTHRSSRCWPHPQVCTSSCCCCCWCSRHPAGPNLLSLPLLPKSGMHLQLGAAAAAAAAATAESSCSSLAAAASAGVSWTAPCCCWMLLSPPTCCSTPHSSQPPRCWPQQGCRQPLDNHAYPPTASTASRVRGCRGPASGGAAFAD
jgi:hypothetical protein